MNPKKAIIPGITQRAKPIVVLAEPELTNRKTYNAVKKPFVVLSYMALPWLIAFILAFAWGVFSEYHVFVQNFMDPETRWYVVLAAGINAADQAMWGGLALALVFAWKIFRD